jgi:hypothetical protein
VIVRENLHLRKVEVERSANERISGYGLLEQVDRGQLSASLALEGEWTDIATRRGRGDFRAAQIGSDRNTQRHEEIRGDFTCWMELPLWPEEQALMDELDRIFDGDDVTFAGAVDLVP